MKQKIINYIVISLVENELEIIKKKYSENYKFKLWLKWLEKNYDTKKHKRIYGKDVEDWRPFGGDKISKLIKDSNYSNYYSSCSSILKQNYESRELVKKFLDSNINLLFIDPFALHLKENRRLMIRIIAHVAKGRDCLVFRIIPDIRCDSIKIECNRILENIHEYYLLNGAKHHVIENLDHLLNVIQGVENIPKTDLQPSPENQNFGDYGDQPMTTF